MDKNLHMGYTTEMLINDINHISTIPTGTITPKPVVKVKTIVRKKPMFIRRTK